jgi:hypothetical protein
MPQGWTASLISFFIWWNSENRVLMLPILDPGISDGQYPEKAVRVLIYHSDGGSQYASGTGSNSSEQQRLFTYSRPAMWIRKTPCPFYNRLETGSQTRDQVCAC